MNRFDNELTTTTLTECQNHFDAVDVVGTGILFILLYVMFILSIGLTVGMYKLLKDF